MLESFCSKLIGLSSIFSSSSLLQLEIPINQEASHLKNAYFKANLDPSVFSFSLQLHFSLSLKHLTQQCLSDLPILGTPVLTLLLNKRIRKSTISLRTRSSDNGLVWSLLLQRYVSVFVDWKLNAIIHDCS